jgi:hypothetical protein
MKGTWRSAMPCIEKQGCRASALAQFVGVVVSLAGPSWAGSPITAPPASPVRDAGWPREYKNEKGRLVVYQPQIDSWENYRKLKARAAVALTPSGEAKPVYGVLYVRAETQADVDHRTVLIGKINIEEARFPSAAPNRTADLTALVRQLVPLAPIAISTDRLIAGLERSKSAAREVQVSLDPPAIFVSRKPAILVITDGKPALSGIAGTDLQFVVNTNWDLFFDPQSGRFYLLNEGTWFSSPSAPPVGGGAAREILGPWTATQELPGGLSRLPADDNWSAVKQHVPARAAKLGPVPVVFTSDKPAELIVTAGKPQVARIGGTHLFAVTNTQSDLFFHEGDRYWYFLTSGRWFRSSTGQGSWEPAGAPLPAEFAQIPADHPKAHVLTSVRGTREADEAVLLASIPQTATVSRTEARAEVSYAGEPQFKPIEGTSVSYAVNTSSDVLRVGDLYYLCFQGVWFVSTSPTGPWTVTDKVAQEIYSIPSSSPKYHVTYVQVYESTPSTVVVGYTSGYTGVYVSSGTVYFGTGYYYAPYVAWGVAAYPVYYPYPYYSYGVAATYNPVTGTYARGAAVYGPYGGYGRAAAYNPVTGTYARAGAAWGPNGSAWGASAANPVTGQYGRAGGAYDPWSDTYAAGYRRGNQYCQWGERVVGSGDDWVHSGYRSTSGGTVAAAETSAGGNVVAAGNGQNAAYVGKDANNNVYAGANGNVYKRDSNGGWYQYNDGGWNQVNKPQPGTSAGQQSGGWNQTNRPQLGTTAGFQNGGLENEARARSWGSQRAQQFGSGPFSNRGGGWSPSNGAFGGGHGFGGGGSRPSGGFGGGGGFRGRRR